MSFVESFYLILNKSFKYVSFDKIQIKLSIWDMIYIKLWISVKNIDFQKT